MSFQTMNAILRMGRRAQAALAAVLLLGASLCAVQAQEIVYYHTDALGTPVAMTNANGAVIQRREFEPYGRQLDPAVLADGPGFTGHVADAATGLVYMQQRYYDPGIGAFLTVDPVTANSPGGTFNRYWYADANPYKFTDPDGRQVSAPKSCHSDNSCIPLSQVKRDDASMMTELVLPPVIVGSTGGLATATGATATVVSATGRAATAAESGYTASAIALVEKAQQVAQTVSSVTTQVATAVAAKATEAKIAVMTSQVTLGAIKHIDAIVDAIEGFVNPGPPPMSPAGVAGWAAAYLNDE